MEEMETKQPSITEKKENLTSQLSHNVQEWGPFN